MTIYYRLLFICVTFATVAFLNLYASLEYAHGAEIPSWSTSKRVMKECYSGWDAVVSLSVGLKSERSFTNSDGVDLFNGSGNGSSFYDSYSSTDDESDRRVLDNKDDEYSFAEESSGNSSSDEFKNSAFVGVKITVPLYSREKRLSRKEATNKAIGSLADLYAKYEGHRATAAALTIEEEVLKRIMLDGGQSAISGYYAMISDREKSIALMRSSKRRILAILEGCGHVEGSWLVGSGQSTEKTNQASVD